METLETPVQQISKSNFFCNVCNYNTSRKCNYVTHITSKKHIRNAEMKTEGNQNKQSIECSKFSCKICNKKFKNRSGLWKHKQKCVEKQKNDIDEEKKQDNLIMSLIKEHNDLINLLTQNQIMMMKILEKVF